METQSPGTAQRTRRMLMRALFVLLEKKRFLKITVHEICAEAMVSRSCFYVHFQDKYELLSACMEELLREKKEQAGGLSLEKQLLGLLEGVQENRRVLYNLLEDNLSREMLGILERIIDAPVRERLEALERSGIKLPGPVDSVAAFCSGGLAGVILRWVREDFRTPREEVAGCQGKLLAALFSVEKEGGMSCV